jgi:GH15 family glucan-1,4-alpha-glucosidase
MSASKFAGILGKEVAKKRWESVANEIKDGILTKLVKSDGTVMKSLRYKHISPEADYTPDASSFYGLFKFGVLGVDSPILNRIYKNFKEQLFVNTDVGGAVRYKGDGYFRKSGDAPSNPWVITTLWFVEYEIAIAKTKNDLDKALKYLKWAVLQVNSAGMLSEQLDAETGIPVSVMPLTWSHAQYVITFLAYIKKLEEITSCSVKNNSL